jgi:hypothetical protein
MISKVLTAFASGLFLLFSTIGFLYFGPVEHTGFISRGAFFQQKIAPYFDVLFSTADSDGVMIGYLSSGDGDLTFRPSSELVFLPARVGQRLSGGTVFSSGEESSALITLVDNSQITLEPNSTVLLDAPKGATDDGGTVSLKVIKGAVSAEKKNADSKINLRIVTPRGRVTKVTKEKLVVVAPKVEKDPRALKTIKDLMNDTTDEEYLGNALNAPNIKDIEKDLKLGKVSSDIKGALPLSAIMTKSTYSEAPLVPPPSLESAASKIEADDRRPASIGTVQQEQSPAAMDASALAQLPTIQTNVAPVVESPTVSATRDSKLADVSSEELQAVAQGGKVAADEIDSLINDSKKATEVKALPPPPPTPAAPRVVGPSKRIIIKKDKVAKFAAGPAGNDITNAMFASRQGDSEESQRLFASALTRKEYHSTGFNDAMRVALDGIMEGHVTAGDCELASDQYGNVERGYVNDRGAAR